MNSLIFIKKIVEIALNLKKLSTIENNNVSSKLISVVVNSFLELTFLQLFFRGKRRDGAFTSIQQETSFQYSSSTCGRPLPKHWQKQWRKFYLQIRMCKSKVWTGMKVLQANSIILGTRKLWRIFPIKQKFATTAAFLDNPNFSIWSILEMFPTVFSTYFHTENTVRNITKLDQIEKFELSKKKLLWYQFSA